MKRGLILRQTTAYKLPHALRLSVGTEEANRLVVAALKDFLGTAVMASPVLYDRLTLIGVGLIGGSIARAGARARPRARNRGDVALRADAAAHSRTGAR